MSILVVAEQSNGSVKKATYAALTAAREIATATGLPIHFFAFGPGAANAGAELATYGGASVLVADDASLQNALAAPAGAAIAAAAKDSGASWVLMASTTTGKDVLPRAAARLGGGLASDIVEVRASGAHVAFVRPMFAGNVLATVEIDTPVKLVTVRTSDFATAGPTGGASPVTTSASAVDAAKAAAGKARFVSFDSSGGDRPELTEADVVVSGGRGLKSAENFKSIMEPLADAFRAAIGASRAAVDSGYAPNDYQVGQTGKVVAPNLYIAVAISGAIQHLAGMKNSKIIVSINKDADAPIFQISDYGLVADAFKAVPEFAAAVKAAKG